MFAQLSHSFRFHWIRGTGLGRGMGWNASIKGHSKCLLLNLQLWSPPGHFGTKWQAGKEKVTILGRVMRPDYHKEIRLLLVIEAGNNVVLLDVSFCFNISSGNCEWTISHTQSVITLVRKKLTIVMLDWYKEF